VAALEILLTIRGLESDCEGKTFQIPSIMHDQSQGRDGDLNDASSSCHQGWSRPKEAYMKAVEKRGRAGAQDATARRQLLVRHDGTPRLVLVLPQDLVNVASVVRIARNFGIDSIRLGIGDGAGPNRSRDPHNTADLVARITTHDSLKDALADCVFAAVLTGRERPRSAQCSGRGRRRGAARRTTDGAVALVAGREDSGLTNEEARPLRRLGHHLLARSLIAEPAPGRRHHG